MTLQCFVQRLCTQPLDDFEPPPSVEARKAMRRQLLESFKASLDLLEQQGLHIVGFPTQLIEEKK